MRDAIGGSVVIVIIVVFIVIALGYMAYNVNYTKAFRMKNKIISVYEEYDGKCKKKCRNEIGDYANSIGYSPQKIICPSGYTSVTASTYGRKKLYCLKKVSAYESSKKSVDDRKHKCYYKVVTKISIEVPIISKIFDLNVFNITGDTKLLSCS